MPSTIQTSWRTKRVTTYGRRTRNVVPIFAPIDGEEDSGHPHSGGAAEGREALDDTVDVKVNPKGTTSRSTRKSKTRKTLRVAPISMSDSKAHSSQNFLLKDASDSKTMTLSRSAILGRSTPSSGKWYDETGIDEVRSPVPRVPLGNIRLPNTPSRQSSSAAEQEHESAVTSSPVLSQARVARKLAKAAPLLREWKERNAVTSKACSDVNKREAAVMMSSRKDAPRSSARLSDSKGKGLAPSPVQRKAPQRIEIIELDSEGDTVNVEIRERKPIVKSLGRVRRIVVSDDENDPESSVPSRLGVSEEESFDSDQQNMPWNTAVHGVPSGAGGYKPKGETCRLGCSENESVPPVPSDERQAVGSIPKHAMGSRAPLVPPCRPFHPEHHPLPSIPPSKQFQPAPVSTPLGTRSLSQRYEEVAARLLAKVPEVVRLNFMRTRDPRLLFSYAESPGQKKVLTDWLEANYFIPTSPDTIFHSYSACGSSEVPVSNVLSQPTRHPLPPLGKRPCLDIISISSNDGMKNDHCEAEVTPHKLNITYGLKQLSLSTQPICHPPQRNRLSFGVISISSDEDNVKNVHRETKAAPRESGTTYGFEQLALSGGVVSSSLIEAPPYARNYKSAQDASGPLLELLKICGQEEPLDFESFIATFPFDTDIQNLVSINEFVGTMDLSFRKIGEASFSEVFRLGRVVLKIIPMSSSFPSTNEDHQGYPSVSSADDVLREVQATEVMGLSHPGFIRLLKTFVVRGLYPDLLLDEWNAYDERRGSENGNPGMFPAHQEYVIIVLPHGGSDLEAIALTHQQGTKNVWRRCASIFWQVCGALAAAEELMEFEHRDLHWGQILIQERSLVKAGKGLPLNDPSFQGLKATIIDLGLSRMSVREHDTSSHSHPPQSHYTEFDEVIFDGDYQFEVYRMMRRHNDNDWRKYSPLTNVMWLHYLSLKLLQAFTTKEPTASKPTSTGGFGEKDCWDSLMETEKCLSAAVIHLRDPGHKRKKAPRTRPARKLPTSASDVLAWGELRGWVW